MQMADLVPVRTLKPLSERQMESLVDQVTAGRGPGDIARILHPKDKIERARARRRIRNVMLTDPRFSADLAGNIRLKLMVGLGPTVDAMIERAQSRPELLAKLILEASGFHNPKVQHEHSGEVKIKLDMPRPKFVDSDAEEIT